jgi:putative two-component system response regulator
LEDFSVLFESPTLPESLQTAKILLVDDDVNNTTLLTEILRLHGFKNLKSINDARGVISCFIELRPDLVVLDLRMPHIDGFEILKLLRALADENICLPVLILSAEDAVEVKCRALNTGAVDYLCKPFFPDELTARLTNWLQVRFQQLHLEDRNRVLEESMFQRTRELEDYQLELKEAQIEIIERLARAAEHRDDDTGHHTQRVGLTCFLLAQALGLPEDQVALIRRASPLHDVGKIGVPDSILLKPGRLTDAERNIMQRHCLIGSDMLSGGHSELVQTAERIALSHHERWDGTGYPQHLRGEAINIEGRILAVADVFDALTHERPYKQAWPLEKAIEEICSQRGRHFDPDVVEAFTTLPHTELL